ncbi:Acetyltransferase (GNAT) domain-containing protein [Psychrobacillus psychrotolerans]|uniref:Acetyltransferase (GNAT) domain-containing protein n=1 Tax=Psychrobacillus psychrotolerans TaxID=126156 RepID=A0A1I6B243_9BACI|nr:GNAT family N-acetyltransferase [Psychrobacillus psychrotolerans]SFQ74975.1 Acetyltransferase (GNAT) domain-containing protein [Psychrobacillus psychrotolerans]
MEEMISPFIQPNLRKLLSFATSERNIDREYELYIHSPVRELYGYIFEDEVVGCIGIEILDFKRCEIKHIAVFPNHRGKGLGSKMISFIKVKHPVPFVIAETDKEAVIFYENYGFKITSLGEKYPGVERFQCILKNK